MKFLKIILTIASIILISENAFAAEKEVKLHIENMTCPSCPFIVKKTLQKVDGVEKVDVNYSEKIASVLFDDNKTSENALMQASLDRGYPARIMEKD